MLSAKLVQLIEDHSEGITSRVLRSIRNDPKLPQMSSLPEAELRIRCQEVLRRLGHWLSASQEAEIASHFEPIGARRARQEIPLHEVVHTLHLLKERILDYIRDQGIDLTTVELYAEEELEHQVGSFFDSVVYHEVLGYEIEARQVTAAAARAT